MAVKDWFKAAPQPTLPGPIAKAYQEDPRLLMAQKLMEQNDFAPVRTPMEGLAKMVGALSGAYIQRKTKQGYSKDADQYRNDLRAAMLMLDTGGREEALNAMANNPYMADSAMTMRFDIMGEEEKNKAALHLQNIKDEAQIKREELRQAAQDARQQAAEAGRDSRLGMQLSAQADLLDRRLAASDAALDRRLSASGGNEPLVEVQNDDGTVTYSRRSDAVGKKAPPKGAGATTKPMNGTVMKQYNTSSEAMKTAQDVQRRLDEAERLFSPDAKGGPVDTGLIARGTRAVTRVAGFGTENTRKLGELDRMREKMRNDYLLLAKGVQTEGDAQRAISALMPYTTDPEEIKAQIRDVRAATKALEEMHRSSMENIELEYGAPGGGSGGVSGGGGVRVVDW